MTKGPDSENRRGGLWEVALVALTLPTLAAILTTKSAANNSEPNVERKTPNSIPDKTVLNFDKLTLPEPPDCIPPPLDLPTSNCSKVEKAQFQISYNALTSETKKLRNVLDPIIEKMTFEEYKELGLYIQAPRFAKLGSDGREEILKGIPLEVLAEMRALWIRAAAMGKGLEPTERYLKEAALELSSAAPMKYRIEAPLLAARKSLGESGLTRSLELFSEELADFKKNHAASIITLELRKLDQQIKKAEVARLKP